MESLQDKLSKMIPLKHFLFTGFARNGFFMLMKVMKWDKKEEIILPAFTCPVIEKTIREAGAVPVPVDAEDEGLNIDPEKIPEAISERTRAIYVVHTYGTAARIDEICAIAKKYNLIVIEDLAHSLLGTYKGRKLGTFGDFAILSFTKKIINYQGGAIATNHTGIFKKMQDLQKIYSNKGALTIGGIIDNYVRLIGSWWESRFSISALVLMKLNDGINKIIYRGSYGIRIDYSKFKSGTFDAKLTFRQLDSYQERYSDSGGNYKKFQDKYKEKLTFAELNQDDSDHLPLYFTGILKKRNSLYRLVSFRTWRNFNEPDRFPRSDYLYENFRIFSRVINYM